jgi:alkylation response protein AidB-like acyl-CoA dehydrogenase
MKRDMQKILSQAEKFVKEELIPLEMALHQHKSWEEVDAILSEKRQMVKAMGLWTPQIPEEYGGLGLSLHEHGQLMEVLGQTLFGLYAFNCQAPDAGNMEILIEFGTEEQKEKYLKPLLQGKIRSCFSMTEKDFAGSNPVHMGTTAVKDGDDYVINGHKWFTSSAEGATFAIVMCITQEEAQSPYARASQIIVPTDTPGFDHVRKISLMGHPGAGWASHSEIRYKDCRVPQSNLLGGEGAGFAIAQTRLGPGRIHHCMRWIGICERAFHMMCERAATRELSPGKPLATKQTIQNWIAESRAEINAARLMVLDAAKKMDEKGDHAVKVEISIIKFYCAQVLQNVLDRAIQVHGALGISDDTPLAFWYGHERGSRIYDGADEVHKSRVARTILKDYGVRVR